MQSRKLFQGRFYALVVLGLWCFGGNEVFGTQKKQNLRPNKVVTTDDVTLRVACTIYAESKGESLDGKRAVASVIYARAGDAYSRSRKATWYGSLKSVCHAGAFSCWNDGWPKAPNMRRPAEAKAWMVSYGLARNLVGKAFTPDIESHFYHEASIRPYWTKGMRMLCQIDNHIFYP